MKRLFLLITILLAACSGAMTSFMDTSLPEVGQKRWVDPGKAQVLTIGIAGCCVASDKYSNEIRQFEILGGHETVGGLHLLDVRFGDGYRGFVRKEDIALFPAVNPLTANEQERMRKEQRAQNDLVNIRQKKFWISPEKSYVPVLRRICTEATLSCVDKKWLEIKKLQTFSIIVGDIVAEHFYEARLDDGRIGYVLAAWINNFDPADKPPKSDVKIGMTRNQVIQSNWGKPKSINRTIVRGGEHEQWVYGLRTYLYFTNDKLTAIQSP